MARLVPLILLVSIASLAQVAAPPANTTHPPAQPVATAAPSAVIAVLPQLQRTVENSRVDLARLRVDKWKTDGSVKQQISANVDSLQRNLSDALPTLVAAAQQNPSSLNASFKLYRNLNVLYDVLSSVTESAGAFGPKEEYAALAQDLGNFDATRRALADAMEAMTAQRDADFVRLQQARQASAQTTALPKKIVIDDNAPAKKSTPKKKTGKPKE